MSLLCPKSKLGNVNGQHSMQEWQWAQRKKRKKPSWKLGSTEQFSSLPDEWPQHVQCQLAQSWPQPGHILQLPAKNIWEQAMGVGCIRGGIVTADACMTNAAVFLGDLSKCCWERDTRAAVAPCWLSPLWGASPLQPGSRLPSPVPQWQHWETQPSAPHVSLPLWEWHCPRKKMPNISWGTCLGKPTATPWVRRPQVPPSVCCDQVSTTPASTFSWGFYSKTYPIIEVRIALMPCCLAYPAQKTFFLNKMNMAFCMICIWLIYNVSLLVLNANRRTSTAIVRTSVGNKRF